MTASAQPSASTSTSAVEHAIYPSLAGKRVVITGGGTGIGAALVTGFAEQGAKVFFLDIAEADSRALEASLKDSVFPPTFLPCNLMDLDALSATFARIHEAAGAVDILINNAANDDRHAITDVSPTYWDERMAVNLRHQFFCAQAVAPGMREQGRGAIINFGSISWHLGLPNLALYMTAKAAIEGLTHGLARDLGAHGVRVNCILPGAIRTPRQTRLWHNPEEEANILSSQCLPKRIEPHDVAAMALFLASDSAAMCTGRNYYVDAGWLGA